MELSQVLVILSVQMEQLSKTTRRVMMKTQKIMTVVMINVKSRQAGIVQLLLRMEYQLVALYVVMVW